MANISKEQMKILINCIGAVETGGQVYGNARYDAYIGAGHNTSNEVSITIGAFQEYNWYAKALLQEILDNYPKVFRSYDNAGIESDLKKSSWDGYSPATTSNKATAIKKIISSPEGKKIQDIRIERLLKGYISFAEKQGVTDVAALFMCANFIHQGGNSACTRILKKTQKPYTLDNLYKACQSDTGNQVGAYKTRQQKMYGWLKEKIDKGSGTLTKEQVIQAMINIASAEVGYLEKASNSNLDSFTQGAGFNNYTKYWRDIKPEYQAQPWCACFVTWVFVQTFGRQKAEELLRHYPYVYCPTLGSLFTRYANPEVGDIVIFYRNGEFVHTGIVVKVSGDYFETIEGNTSGGSSINANGGGVFRKSYYNSSLPGTKFCRPDYSLVTSLNSSTSSNKNWLELGDSGASVKDLQEKLMKLGYDLTPYGADGDFGSKTDSAVRKFQADKGLQVDGQAGKATMQAIDQAINDLVAASQPNNLIAQGQIHLNNFIGAGLKITGKRNLATRKAYRRALKTAMNMDYGLNLSTDNGFGTPAQTALRNKVVREGSRGFMVTTLEIGLLLRNIDPSGVESPGIFASGLLKAVKAFQKKYKLEVDGEAGYNTFMKLQKL